MRERRERFSYENRHNTAFMFGFVGFFATASLGYWSLLILFFVIFVNSIRGKKAWYYFWSILGYVLGGALVLTLIWLRAKYDF